MERVHVSQERSIQPHVDEHRRRVKSDILTLVAQIEVVVLPLQERDVNVHPLHWLVGGVIDRMGVTEHGWSAGGRLEHRSATVDGELSLAIQDYEHFFAIIMEVMPDSAMRIDNAAVQELKVRVQTMEVQQRGKRHLA